MLGLMGKVEVILALGLVLFAFVPEGPIAVLLTAGWIVHLRTGTPRWPLAGMYLALTVVLVGLVWEMFLAPKKWDDDTAAFPKRVHQDPSILWWPFRGSKSKRMRLCLASSTPHARARKCRDSQLDL